MKQCFSLAKIDRGKQVDITVMYLIGDAKLWRRTIIKDEFNDGWLMIDTWEHMKPAFISNNTS